VAKLTRLTHKTTVQLHLVAESCTICSPRSRRPVRKLLDTPSYNIKMHLRKLGWESVERIHLTQDRNQWWALVDTVMKLGVP
jgi:hypothetical protein